MLHDPEYGWMDGWLDGQISFRSLVLRNTMGSDQNELETESFEECTQLRFSEFVAKLPQKAQQHSDIKGNLTIHQTLTPAISTGKKYVQLQKCLRPLFPEYGM